MFYVFLHGHLRPSADLHLFSHGHLRQRADIHVIVFLHGHLRPSADLHDMCFTRTLKATLCFICVFTRTFKAMFRNQY